MTISDIKNIFQKELTTIYNSSEIAELSSIFIEKSTGFNKIQQRQLAQDHLSETQWSDLNSALSELKTSKPFQQILGETEFYGFQFFVDENVLIPRPETEELLELAILKIQNSKLKLQGLKIVDIGTGSGVIPIVLKKHFPDAEISAVDFSEMALKIARKNAEFHQVEINFLHQDYLSENLTEVYDVIISNPPYIGLEEAVEIEDNVKDFEPQMALFSPTSNALIFYEKIAKDCKNHLSKNGLLFLEINQKLGIETKNLFVDVLSEVELIKDLSENDRFVIGS